MSCAYWIDRTHRKTTLLVCRDCGHRVDVNQFRKLHGIAKQTQAARAMLRHIAEAHPSPSYSPSRISNPLVRQ